MRGATKGACFLPVVNPVMELEEAKLRTTLFQVQPQLLHVAPAVIHSAVAPVPDTVGKWQC